MGEYQHVFHTFLPVYDEESEILILGSFPSVKSREQSFYYGHPQNRFWKVLEILVHECKQSQTTTMSIEEKRQMLLVHHIALWDVIEECDIAGSSDSSIKNVKINAISEIVRKSKIHTIYTNGATATKLYQRYAEEKVGMKCIQLPSTSPANAAYSLERLCEAWSCVGSVRRISKLPKYVN